MAFKHYDVVRAITPYTLMQAIAAEGDVVVSGATEPE